MDTNNRQNWSTQNDESRAPGATGATGAQRVQQHPWDGVAKMQPQERDGVARGRHARPKVQPKERDGVAFGTSKHPEGFVTTWKKATHTWRWRAVLCVFLALLLMMMQPTGTALYRSWNAASGEAQGLGAAFATGDDIVPGTADFTHDPYDISDDDGEGAIMGTTDTYIPSTGGNDGYLNFGKAGTIYFFPTVNEATLPYIHYASYPGTTLGTNYLKTYESDSAAATDTNAGAVYLLLGDALKYDNKFITMGDISLTDPNGNPKVYELSPDASNGMMGAYNASGPTSLTFNDTTGATKYPTNTYTALGYKLDSWIVLRSEKLDEEAATSPAKDVSLWAADQAGLDAKISDARNSSGNIIHSEANPNSKLEHRVLVGGTSLSGTSVNNAVIARTKDDTVQGDITRADDNNHWAYAVWAPSKYRVEGRVAGTLANDNNAAWVYRSGSSANDYNLTWSSNITISPNNNNFSAASANVAGALASDSTSWVVVNSSSDLTPRLVNGKAVSARGGEQVALYDLLNPFDSTSASVDPAVNGQGVVYVAPYNTVTFHANGGTGGRTSYFQVSASDAKNSATTGGVTATLYTSNEAGASASEIEVSDSDLLMPYSGTGNLDVSAFNEENTTSFTRIVYADWDVYAAADASAFGEHASAASYESLAQLENDMDDSLENFWTSLDAVPATAAANGSGSGGDDGTYYFETANASISFPSTTDVGEGKDFQAPDSSYTLAGWSETPGGEKVADPGNALTGQTLTGSRDYYAIWERGGTTSVTITDANGTFKGKDGDNADVTPTTLTISGVPEGVNYANIRFGAITMDGTAGTAAYADDGAQSIETVTGASALAKNPTAAPSATTGGYWSGGTITAGSYPATLAAANAQVATAASGTSNTLTYTHTADVAFAVSGTTAGTLGSSPLNVTSATVKYVPYGTQYGDINFNAVTGQSYYIYSSDASPTYTFANSIAPVPTDANSYSSTGTWSDGTNSFTKAEMGTSESAVVASDTSGTLTLTYTFSPVYTLTLATDPAAGTFKAGTNSAVTSLPILRVPSGVTYTSITFNKSGDDYVYAEGGDGDFTIDGLTKAPVTNGYDTSGYWSGANIDSTNAKPATVAAAVADATADPTVASAMPAAATTLTFSFAQLYDVKFMQENGTTQIGTTQQVAAGGTPTEETAPAKAADAQYTYAFDGWRLSTDTSDTPTLYGTTAGAAFPAVSGNVTYVAHYAATEKTFTVRWKKYSTDADADALKTDTGVAWHGTQTPPATNPEETDTDEWDYTFDGWTVDGDSTGTVYTGASGSEFPVVEADVTYVAHFAQVKKTYDVTLTSSTGKFSSSVTGTSFGTGDSTIQTVVIKNVPYGTDYKDIHFVGASVEGTTATVTYSDNTSNTSIDGLTLAPASAAYSGTPTWSGGNIDGSAASMAAAKTSESVDPTVTGATTLTLTYEGATYTVTFNDYNDSQIQSGTLAYGAQPSCPAPTRAATAQYTYTFAGWKSSADNKIYGVAETAIPSGETFGAATIPAVSGDVTYTAQYTEATNSYTITWLDGNGNQLKQESLAYGTTPSYSGDTPTKTATAEKTYTFNNTWSPTITEVTENATYTAQFDESTRQYTVKFYAEDGTTALGNSPYTLDYGSTLVGLISTTPTKAATADTTYTFDGWEVVSAPSKNAGDVVADADLGTVSGDASYKAHFASSDRTYSITVSLKQNDGTTSETGTYNGHTGSAFTIEGVPYNVVFSAVKFNWKGETSGTTDYTTGTYATDGTCTATDTPTPSTGGQNTSGTGWSPDTSTTPSTSTAFTYTFGVDSYTVTYVISGGTWASTYATSGNVTRTDDTTLTQTGYSYGVTVNDTGVPSTLAANDGTAATSQSMFTPSAGYTKTVEGGTTYIGSWYTLSGGTYTVISGTPYGKQVTGDTTYVYALTPVHNVTWKQAVGTDASLASITDIQTDQVWGTNAAGIAPSTGNTTSAPTVASPGSGYTDRGWYTGTAISDSTMGVTDNALGTSGTITPTSDLTYTRYFAAADVTYYIVVNEQTITGAKAVAGGSTDGDAYDQVVLTNAGAEGSSASGITVKAGQDQSSVVRTALNTWAVAKNGMFSLSTYDMNWSYATTSDNGSSFNLGSTNGKVASINNLSFTPTENGQAIVVYFTRDKHKVTEKYTYTEGSTADEKPANWSYLTHPDANKGGAEYYYGESYTLTDTSSYTPTNGYAFGGWKASGSSTAVTGGTMGAADVSYTGDWTRNDIDVVVHNANPSDGTISVSGGTITKSNSDKTLTISGKYKYGDTVSAADFTTTPITGRAFSDWYTSETGGTTGNFGTTSPLIPTTGTTVDTGLWAQWVQTFAITYTAGAHAGSNFHGWTASNLSQGISLEHYGYTDGATASGDSKTRATSDITTAEAGYEFAGWSWEIVSDSSTTGSWTYDASDTSGRLNNPVYAAGTTTLTGGITVTANYQGTAHTVTLANNLDSTGWTGVDSSYTGTGALTSGGTVRTGDTMKLPTASQLARTGYTLTSYTIAQEGADYGSITVTASSTSNIEKTVLAGTSPYTGGITITANYTPNTHTVSFGWKSNQSNNQVTAPTTLTTSAATTATYNRQYTIPSDLWTTAANIPAGHTLTSGTPVVVVPTDKVAEYRAGSYTPSITVSGNATNGYYLAASDVPDEDFTILTVWDINKYWVTWELSDSAKVDYEKNSVSADKLTWSVQSGTTLNDGTVSRVAKDAYVEYGTTYASLLTSAPTLTIGSNLATKYKSADQATWTPSMTSGGGYVGDSSSVNTGELLQVNFVLTPAEYTYNVQVNVTNGTATIGSTTAAALTFSNNAAYGTAVKDVTYDAAQTQPLSGMTVARTDDNYEDTPTWTLQVNTDTTTGTAAAAAAPMTSSTPVTGYMVYRATFAQKEYTLNYTLADVSGSSVTPKTSLDSGATTLSKTSESSAAKSGQTLTQAGASAPTLTNATDGFVAAKYGALTWYTWDGANAPVDVTDAVTAGTLPLNDSIATDMNSDGKKDSITLYAVPSVNNKTVTVHIVNGTVDGTSDTYTNANVPYGTKIGDILTSSEVDDFTPSAGASHNTDIAVWSNYGSGAFLSQTYDGLMALSSTSAAPGNQEVTGDVELTLTFPTMRAISYAVQNGMWSDSTSTTHTYYVPDGKTLATYYTTAANDDDASARHTGTTGLAVPSVGNWPATGYSGENDGTWSRTSGDTGIDPTAEGANIGDSLTATAAGDVTYTYAYAPLSNLSVTVKVHYQNKTLPAAAADRGIAADYDGDSGFPTATVTLTNQTFGRTITVSDLLAAISNDEPAAGYIKVPVGFKRELADHSTDTGLSAAGVQSTTSYVVQASDNEFHVYLDRYLVDYTYTFATTPTGFNAENNPVTPQQARYGEEVALWTTTDTYVSSGDKYAFQGWKVAGDDTYYKGASPKYTMTPAASNGNTTFATTAFTGYWVVASYEVNYRLLNADDLTALDGKKLVDSDGAEVLASFAKDEYDTGATLDPASENIGATPTGSAITLSNAKKYKTYGWVYSKDGGSTWVTSGEGYLVLDSPADVPGTIEDDNYVFAPITQMQRYTVTFRAGPYAKTQLNGGEALAGVLDFTVKYGDAIPNSPYYDTSDPTNNTGTANNMQTLVYLQNIGFTDKGCVELDAASYLRMFKQNTTTDGGNRSNWQAVNGTADNILTGDLVGGDIEYQWKFPDQTYTIYFMNIEGTDLLNAISSATTTIKSTVGSYTALQWSGVANGTDGDTNTLLWTDSIFENMENDTYLQTVKAGVGDRTVNAWMNPQKEGATFAGWVIGTSEKPADYAAQTPNTDILVKDIWASGFNGAGGNGQVMYVWATWENNPATLTYHNNFTNVELDGACYANEGQNLTTSTAKADVTKAHSGTLTTNSSATLATRASLGDDFNPTGYTFLGWTDRANASSVAEARTSTQSGGALWADGGSYTIGTTETHDLYAVYQANAFKVQWTDFSGNKITVKQAIDAGIITDAEKGSYGYVSDASSDPFTQTVTYNATSGNTLMSTSGVFTNDATKATTNPNGRTFVKWRNGTKLYSDGDDVSTGMATENGTVVVLEPTAKTQYTLTYVYGNGTTTTVDETHDVLVDGDEGYDAHPGEAPFSLTDQSNTVKDTYTGYNLTGWKLGSTTYGLNDTVYLSASNTTGGKAQIEAVWEAANADFTVVRHYPKSLNASDGEVTISTVANVPTRATGDSSTITSAEAAAFIADDLAAIAADTSHTTYGELASYAEQSYSFDKSECTTTTVAATGTQIDVYYKLNTITLTYKYTGVSGYEPNPSTQTIIKGASFTLPTTDGTLPANRTAKGKWMMIVKNGNKTTYQELGDPGETITSDAQYYPTADTTITLQTEAAKYTVSFVPDGTTATWADGTTTVKDQKVEGGKKPTSSLVPALKNTSTDDGTYELVWTSSLTGAAADPFNTTVTEAVTYTASYKLINVVSYSLGEHAKFAATATGDVTSYTGLASTYDMANGQKADSSATAYGQLTLIVSEDSGITATGGKPTAADGWQFTGWEMTDSEGTVVKTAAELPDLSDVYALTNLEKSYTFTAQYTETEQRVTFVASADGEANAYPGSYAGKEHASTSATSYVWGYTGSDKSAAKRADDSALDDSYLADGVSLVVPTAPAAAPGYEFAGWQGSLDGVNVTLGTTSENTTFTIPKADTTLYAVYEPIGVELNFESANAEAGAVQTRADGTVVANSVTTEALSSVVYTAKAIPQPGKKFTGWVSTSDLTFDLLDAGWYTTTKDDGEGGTTALDKTDAAYGLLTVGKSAADTDNGIPAMYFSGDYQAQFADDPYEVTFVSADESKLAVSATYYGDAGYQAVKWGQKPTLGGSSGNSVTTTPANAGYSFSHWEYAMYEEYLDGDTLKVKDTPTTGTTLDPTSVTIKGDTVFTAKYTENMGSLVFMANADEGATVEGSTTGYTEVRPGVEVDIPDCGFTWAGHTFKGWTLDKAKTGDSDLIQPTSESGTKYTTKGGAEVMYAVWDVDQAQVVYHNGAIADDVTKFTNADYAGYQNVKYFVADVSASVDAPGATDYTVLGSDVWTTNASDALENAISRYSYMTDWDGVPGYIRFDTRVPGYARTLVGWATTEGGEVVYEAGDTILAADMPTGKGSSTKIDLYAVWADTQFTVSLNGGGARTIDATKTADKQVTWGKSVTIAAVDDMYRYNRHTFDKWEIDANATTLSTISNNDGTAFTFTFKGTGDTTLTASWNSDGSEPEIVNVVFHDMKANNKTLGTAGDRAWSDMPMANGTYASQIASPEGYYTFRGWYITAPSQGGTEPDATFAKNYGIGDYDSATNTFTFDNDKNVEWLLKTYYNETQPLKNKVGQYLGDSNPPIYWNSTKVADDGTIGDWTDAFWDVKNNGQRITIDVYGWADLVQYDVNFKANTPTTDATLTGETETPQTLAYKKAEAQTLNENAFDVPGYTFAYWLKPSGDTASGADASAGTLPAQLANGTTAFTGQQYADQYTVAANASLLTTSEVNSGSNQVNLYAMWNESYDNKVVYNLTYDGDGASNAAVSGHATNTISGLAWRNNEVTDHLNATIVLPGQAGYGGTTVAGEGDPISTSAYPGGDEYWNYVFDGWWTSKDSSGVQVTPGTDTMETAVLRALENDPSAVAVTTDSNGVKNYTLTLYAHWTATSATVKYDLNGGEPVAPATADDYADEVKGLGSDGTATTTVALKDATALKKLGQKATGWTASENFYTAAGGTATTVYGTSVAFPNSLAGDTVTMTANFVPRAYTVEFNYANADTPGKLEIGGTTYDISGLGYSGAGAYTYGGNETTVGWNDGYAVWPTGMQDPVKEGYTFGGYTVSYGDGKTLALTAANGKGWTVKQLAEAISAEMNPTLSPGEQQAAADDVRGTQDGDVKSYELTATWTANNYTVTRHLGGAKYGNDTTSTLSNVKWTDKDLLLDESAMTNPGYSNVKWYLDEECTVPVDGDDPALKDIAAQWHAVSGNESATFGPSVDLYAQWEESKATITFTLDKTAYGKVNDGTTTGSEVEYVVGSASGYIYADDGSGNLVKTTDKITDKTVTATIDAAYQDTWEVIGWAPAEGNTATDPTTQFKLGTFNGSGEYTDKTYVAQVSGKSYGYTVTHLFQSADGSFDSLPAVTAVADVTAAGGSLVDATGTAAFGTSFTRAELAETLAGFTLDESGSGLTIGADATANAITLKYNRAQHDLSFAVAVEGGSSTPAAPEAHTGVYYQHEEALPGNTSASDSLPVVPGYKFAGWYENYVDATDRGTLVSSDAATATYTMGDADVTLTAVYEVDSFNVTIADTPKYDTGAVDANGDTVYANADSSYGTTVVNAVTPPVSVVSGKTLGDTGLAASYNMVVGPTGNQKTLGAGSTLLSTVTCADNVAVTWLMTTPAGDYIGMTDDPTSEVITQDVVFTPIVSKVWLIKYLPGTKGDFKTSKAAGTLIEIDPDAYAATGYSLLDYLYPDKDDYTVLPAGKPGYEFVGWHVAYGTYDSGTSYYTNEQLMANGAEFGALKTSITLTAMWKPGSSYVKFDLNAPEQGVTSFNDDPSGNYAIESQVPLPTTSDTDADGYTLAKWTLYAVDDAGNETKLGDYAAGGSFEMPGSDSTEDSPKLIARATWTEDYATITYVSSDAKKGSVTTGSEQIGFWTGTPKAPATAVKGSVATPESANYTFEGWTVDGAEVTTATTGTIAKGDLLKDASGKYVEATYTANFKGVPRVVRFLVADDSFIDNDESKPMGQIWGYNSDPTSPGYGDRRLATKGLLLKQTVEYGDTIDIAKYGEAVPETNYKLKNGNCWDYTIYDAEGGSVVESGAVTDTGMREMAITGAYTVFAVHFVYDDGDYTVNWYGRNGAAQDGKPNFTSKSTWGRTVTATRTVTKVGYVFTGWFTDVPPADATVDDGSAAYNAAPGSTQLNGQSYGTLAGGTYATDAPDGTKDHIDLRAGWRVRSDFSVVFNDNAVDTSATTPKSEASWTANNVKWEDAAAGYTVDSATYTAKVSGSDYLFGYEFDGWWTQREGGTQVFDASGTTKAQYCDLVDGDESVESVTLYAHWLPKTYYVAYQSAWGYDDNPHTYGSGTDGDPYVVYGFTIDGTTSVYPAGSSQNGLVIAAPANTDDNWAWKEWQYLTSGTGHELNSTWTVRMLKEANADTATIDGKTCYLIKGVWNSKVVWETVYELYENTGTAESPNLVERADLEQVYADKLTVRSYGMEGDEVAPDFNYEVPGFMSTPAAAQAKTLERNGSVASLDDVKATLAKDPSDPSKVVKTFYVALLPKEPYTLSFDLNDTYPYTSGGYTHAATLTSDPDDGDLVTVTDANASTLDQDNKNYLSIENTPHYVDPDDADNLLYYLDPTRPGFAFGGWYNVPIDDASGTGAGSAAVEVIGGENGDLPNQQTLYGDLARDAEGNWSDPGIGNGFTLYAKWVELTRTVYYSVATDQADLVTIRLNSEDDSAYSTDERTEVIGAVTGDKFSADGATRLVNADGKKVAQGAVAKAARGYHAVWRVVAADAAPTFDMPLPAYPDGVVTAAMTSLSDVTDVVATYASAVAAAGAGEGANMSAAAITAEAEETSLEGNAYDSDDGQSFASTAAITPGVRTDDGLNLFAGDAMDDADGDATSVMYVAAVEENAAATVTTDPGDGSTPTKATQPAGTYIGEKPGANGHYGQNDGALPKTPTRDGYTFGGWKLTAAAVAYNADGTVAAELPAGTVLTGSEPYAGRIAVPEGGIGLEAQWTKDAEPAPGTVTHVVTVPETVNPDTGETIPASTYEVPDGETLTDDQIADIVKRGDKYPQKWNVSYYDPETKTTRVKEGMTVDELIAFLQEHPVTGDMTIAVAADSDWSEKAPVIPPRDTKVRPAKSKAAKTGDAISYIPFIGGAAVVAALVLAFLLLLKRRRDE